MKTLNHRTTGFSLVEVTIALALAAVALLAIIGMMSPAMESARDSADQTAIGAVLEDIHDRLEGMPLVEGVPEVSPLHYDQQGRYVDINDPEDAKREAFFKADLELAKFHADFADEDAPDLLVLSIELFWPLDASGIPLGKNEPKTTVSYPVTSLTGPDWSEIEPGFEPKIEF